MWFVQRLYFKSCFVLNDRIPNDQGAKVPMFGRKNKRNFGRKRLALTFDLGY